ncbi:MAG: FAD-dependent oxidoreductase [Thermodesulfobacteriota bacterium]
MSEHTSNKVLVIGGGVGGLKTSLDLAEAERDVILIDKAPSIGGLMTQLDRTFPTNNCDMCTLSPHLAESGRELHIDIRPLTEVASLAGRAGDFEVTLRTRPRYINLERCTACGDCHQAFPECVNFTPGLDARAPTCMRYPQATPVAFSIDLARCPNVDELVRVCRAGAIIPDEVEKTVREKVGSIVVATGAGLFDPAALSNYGHGRFPNVVSGLEYERIMYASGPTGGRLVRPSDGRQPGKVAWIQCVGSRNLNRADAPYCSSVCCMYALKEAMVTKERFRDDIEAVIFYMDMRTSGKDYELYLERARHDYSVRLVRCRPHSVERDPATENLLITYLTEDGSGPRTETFDMVVLSAGFKVPPDLIELSRVLGLELNEYNFARTEALAPVSTSKPGVYVCGVFEGPKDIPETIVQASAAAALAAGHLAAARGPAALAVDLPPERDVAGEPPRIGVFLCDCGENIGGVIEAGAVAAYAAGLPGVVVAETVGYGCSRESLAHIEDVVKDKGLNRLVIGGCSPRTHETKFQDMARRAGLNKYLVEMANLRDQDTWVHAGVPVAALAKAKELVRMAVSAAAFRRPLKDHTLPVNKDVLVVGGGATGLTAALNLAEAGHKVFLVERERELGGLARRVRRTLEGDDVPAWLDGLIARVKADPRIRVMTGALIVDHSGQPGLFRTGVQFGPQMAYRQINHGVTILATGALAHRPQEYLLDRHPAVMTQLDLDNLLEDDPNRVRSWRQVVMIQCVGSRTKENPNCSRLCCQSAIKNALRIKELNPAADLFVLNRDVRTYGFQEDYYRRAREKGVVFVRYSLEDKPEVKADGDRVAVVFTDPILGRRIEVPADCLALGTGLIADDENTEDLATIFRLPRTHDGYFLEDHVKLRPMDLPVPGFLAAGTAHSPKNIRESVAQGLAAAGRALAMLARDEINLGAVVARVDGKKCAACLICVRACPYAVPFINADGYSEIDPAKCHGCGICAAECPAKAIQLLQFEDDQVLGQLDGLLEGLTIRRSA